MTQLLKIKDVAQRLGVTRQTMHNMLNENRFPVAPIPGTKPRRWRSGDIEAYLAGSVIGEPAE